MKGENLLARFERIRAELARISTVDEAKDIRDKAEALRVYYRQADAGLEMQNKCAEIKLRAERRAGEILAAMPKAEGQLRRGNTKLPRGDSPSLKDVGISKIQSSRWQAVAKLPAKVLDAHIEKVRETGQELTTAGVLKLARKPRPVPEDAQTDSRAICDFQKLVDSGKTFATIYADPPWQYGNQATRAATQNHYRTMTAKEIVALPVETLAAAEAHLHLWTTNAFLFEAKAILEAWGFTYKGVFVWVKPQMGIGNYYRVSHEFMLLGVRGGLRFRDKSVMSWLRADRLAHSHKPEAVRQIIEKVSPPPRLELFARATAPGWTSWGNEVQELLI